MASADPVSEKIDNTMNLFRQNIDEKKAEVNRIREEMKLLIDKKSDELLRELDEIWKEVNEKEKKKEEFTQNIRDLQEHQKAMEDLLRKMNTNPSFTQMTEVSERIETFQKEIDLKTPVVKLSWKVDTLRDSINTMCSCNVLDAPDTPPPATPEKSACHSDPKHDKKMSVEGTNRVVAYFDINGKDVEIPGTILTKLSDKSGQVYYEIHTDKHIGLRVRDKEVRLKAYRTSTTYENSLFVRTDQCVQEDPDHQNLSAPPLPPNHPTAYNGAVTNTERKTTFILGDLITLPLDEGTNRLINGTVGYSGIYKNREVVELCADTKENTSAFICSIRDKYELPNFPDHLRHHDMKGFSLVVDTNTVIPHIGPVSSRRKPNTFLGHLRKLTKDHGRTSYN